jgi:hypothetical protein
VATRRSPPSRTSHGTPSRRGHTFLDGELYLPEDWAQDEERRTEAGVPEDVVFAKEEVLICIGPE